MNVIILSEITTVSNEGFVTHNEHNIYNVALIYFQ